MAKVLNNQQLLDRRMKGLSFDGAPPAAPVGAVQGTGTGTSDSNLAALSRGEYVLPEATTAVVGKGRLDQLVRDTTGQEPGGKPVAPMHKRLSGFARGGALDTTFSDGNIGPFAGGALDTTFSDGNIGPFAGGALDTTFSDGNIGPFAGGALDTTFSDGNIGPFAGGALDTTFSDGNIPRVGLMGLAGGGMIDDLYGETQAKRAALRNYTPQPGNFPEQPAPRAPELRNFTPEPGRLQPGGTPPRISGIAPPPAAPSVPPVSSQGIADRVARSAAPKVGAAPAGMTPTPAASINYDIPPGHRARVGTATAAEFEAAQAAQRGAAPAAAPAAAKQGLISRLAAGAKVVPQTVANVAKSIPGFQAATGGLIGAGQSLADMGNGYRDEFNRSVGAESPLGTLAADTARTLANVGDAATFGLAGRIGRGIASATGGGSFGEGFTSDSDRDRFLASRQPQQVAQAPQMTDRERQDDIARRRAALEGPQAAVAPTANAAPAPVAAPAAAPKRGPIAGLAARAAKPAAAAQPSAPAIDPAVMADAQAAQAELDQSPIARVIWGSGGATVQYKDGTTKQTTNMDEVNAFHALTNRAAQQYAAQPVEIIAGRDRAQAVPELGYQIVPDAVARTGKTGDYVTGLAQAAMDRADPVAAELRARLAEIAAQGDNSIRVSNAAPDRDAAGRGLRNDLARIELSRKQQEADLEKQALSGNQEAIQRLNLLRSNGKSDDSRGKLVTDLVKAYSSSTMQPVGADGKPMTLEQFVSQGVQLASGGTAQPGPSYEQFAAQIRAKNPGANVTDAQLQAAYKQQFQKGQ
uniref:Uncharacterized protein n=1 Tax=Aromatoleum anaerobium TaxID=182180 RepID=A0ABX1PNS7_9RHOO